MAKSKDIYSSRNTFTDRAKRENESFPELQIKIRDIETALLLLSSAEDMVLVTVLKYITEFIRKDMENIKQVKETNVLEHLMSREFYFTNEMILVKRFCLYNATAIVESTNTLLDFDTEKTKQIIDLCLRFYIIEDDDFCIEYLSVMINKCLDDPQVVLVVLQCEEYLNKFFGVIAGSTNPDVLLHSLESLHKLLLVQNTESRQEFVAVELFPIDRAICELTNEFMEIRNAALKVIRDLITDTSDTSPFAKSGRSESVLQQLLKVFCDNATAENLTEVVAALATAMRTEKMAKIFIEYNLFDKITQNMEANRENYSAENKCMIISIFAEISKYPQFLPRVHTANITDMFMDCLLHSEMPATHILCGLNRIMKLQDAVNKLIESYHHDIVEKLLRLMKNKETPIKTREQSAELVSNLLLHAFHSTAQRLLELGVSEIIGDIFSQSFEDLSIDYILAILGVIESLAQNNEYRTYLGESPTLGKNLALLLKNSFSTTILVNNIFRCLCTLVDEEGVRAALLAHHICASIKRGLRSLANLIKSSVTNFIMQTTRFPELLNAYIEQGVLEVLIMHQKHSFCVATWNPAIESVLSKCPTMKFCIRNHLSFTDSTVGNDFLVSKKKFDDFRVFQSILKEEVSPLQSILVVTFNRPQTPSALIVKVPVDCFLACEMKDKEEMEGWCYCREPGDEFLPVYLEELNKELEKQGLVEDPTKVKRCIDFDNVAKRVKVVANIVNKVLSENLKGLDLNSTEECSQHIVQCHLRALAGNLHCNFIPLGHVRSGCQFERAILFKALADQIGLPSTLQRSVDGRFLFNEVPLPIELDHDVHCDRKTMKLMPWRMLRPTHIVDLMYNVGELYPVQSRQALQYLRLY